MPVEVAPIAHYHMGGVEGRRAHDERLPGLFAAGEVVGGANGANRLSGNAITESVGVRPPRRPERRRARRACDAHAIAATTAGLPLDLLRAGATGRDAPNTAAMIARLQAHHGRRCRAVPHRRQNFAARSPASPRSDESSAGGRSAIGSAAFDLQRLDWFDLRNMLRWRRRWRSRRSTAPKAAARISARIFRRLLPHWQVHQRVRWRDGDVAISGAPAEALAWHRKRSPR